MENLDQAIKEIEDVSLYRFKDSKSTDYTFAVLYVSPDDIHTYVGFRVRMNPQTLEKKIFCEIGKFYVYSAKRCLFVDNPELSVEVSEKIYRTFFNKNKNLSNVQMGLLADIWPINAYDVEK